MLRLTYASEEPPRAGAGQDQAPEHAEEIAELEKLMKEQPEEPARPCRCQ